MGSKTGHALNNELLKKFESENAYKIIEIDEIKDAPINYLKPISEEFASMLDFFKNIFSIF